MVGADVGPNDGAKLPQRASQGRYARCQIDRATFTVGGPRWPEQSKIANARWRTLAMLENLAKNARNPWNGLDTSLSIFTRLISAGCQTIFGNDGRSSGHGARKRDSPARLR